MKRKKIIVFSILILLLLVLTGCFATKNAIIFDDDWTAYVAIDIITNKFGPSEEELDNMVSRLKLFFPEFRQINSGKQYIRYISTDKVKIEQLEFIKKENMENGDIKININLPTLITAKDDEGKASGAAMNLELYLPGVVVEANTLDYSNDYVMQSIFAGKKRARVMWQLSEEHLLSPTTLWVKLKPYSND